MSDLLQELAALKQEHLPSILSLIDETVASSTPEGSSLVEMNAYHFQTGGKRLRALLPLAVSLLLLH